MPDATAAVQRLAARLPGVWAGVMLAIALMVAPAAFAMLGRPEAGRLMGHIFALEAGWGLALAALLLLVERHLQRKAAAAAGAASALSSRMLLLLGTLFCTVAGYYGLQPLLAEARAGQGSLGFGALHAISTVFFGVKALLWLALAWRVG